MARWLIKQRDRSAFLAFTTPLAKMYVYTLTHCGYLLSPYRAVNTLHFGYKNQSVNDAWSKSYSLLWDPHTTHKCKVISMQNCLMLNLVVSKVTSRLSKVYIPRVWCRKPWTICTNLRHWKMGWFLVYLYLLSVSQYWNGWGFEAKCSLNVQPAHTLNVSSVIIPINSEYFPIQY